MNEKINGLAIRSQLVSVNDLNGDLVSGWQEGVDLTEYLEDFAELIVKECIFELVHESTLQSNKEVQDFTVNVVNRFKERFALEQ